MDALSRNLKWRTVFVALFGLSAILCFGYKTCIGQTKADSNPVVDSGAEPCFAINVLEFAGGIENLRVSPDGKWIAFSRSLKLVIAKSSTAEIVFDDLIEGLGYVRKMYFAPSGRSILMCGTSNTRLVTFAEGFGKVKKSQDFEGANLTEAYTFSSEAPVLAFALQDRVVLCDLNTGEQIAEVDLEKYGLRSSAIHLSAKAGHLLVAQINGVMLFDVQSQKALQWMPLSDSVSNPVFSNDGTKLICTDLRRCRVVDLQTGKERNVVEGVRGLRCVALDSEANRLLFKNGSLFFAKTNSPSGKSSLPKVSEFEEEWGGMIAAKNGSVTALHCRDYRRKVSRVLVLKLERD